MKKVQVLIAGGGTGGHISPGIALYEEFRDKNISCCFLAERRDKRFASLKEINEGDLLYYRAPVLTGNIFKLPMFMLSFTASVINALRIVKESGARVVVGMGGYVSAPLLIAAVFSGTPVFLCEQNTVPGKVTKYFSRWALKIFTTFKATEYYMKQEYQEKLLPVGNPVRKKVLGSLDKNTAKTQFNLQHCEKIILVIGGSQGALKINELIYDLKIIYPEAFRNVGILWSTGEQSYQKFKNLISTVEGYGSIYMSPFIENVGNAYNACDIAVSRSGSGVMMELAAKGIPSILIPYPYAAMDHQDKNAEVFADAGAAIKIKNEDAIAEKVFPILKEMLSNKTTLKRMSVKARNMAKPEAADDIVATIMKEISV